MQMASVMVRGRRDVRRRLGLPAGVTGEAVPIAPLERHPVDLDGLRESVDSGQIPSQARMLVFQRHERARGEGAMAAGPVTMIEWLVQGIVRTTERANVRNGDPSSSAPRPDAPDVRACLRRGSIIVGRSRRRRRHQNVWTSRLRRYSSGLTDVQVSTA
ncbi:hypothetical protein KZZ52_37615 [Dactylosporangium sp. AC04546]|uniref:hypothetical protein n=1 Tax=Dactylosporangium sp. AC04546 TaxID=2862460 RepID=UPI001EDF891E|nr:hypothetical protein [Dactylosporangium sp. AC04546]WVK79683.1 hypothetical protein KZZ52_37615 [Dactylosporangium sp. AC04546]